MTEIAVIGAGLMGLSCALNLARDGHAVTVFDRAPQADKCSWGNAGGIAVTDVAPAAMPGALWRVPGWLLHPRGPLSLHLRHAPWMVPWFRRFAHSARAAEAERIAAAMAPLLRGVDVDLRALLAAIGLPDALHPAGALTVYGSRAAWQADALEWALRRRHGIECRDVTAEEARALEPALGSRTALGMFTPAWSHVSDPKRIWSALLAAVCAAGVQVQTAAILGISGPGELRLDAGGGAETARFARIVVAAGAWSARLARSAGDRVLLESERGYHVMLAQPDRPVTREIIFGERKFVATPLAAGLRLAGTAEFAGLSARARWQRARMLPGLARDFLPDLPRDAQGEWMGQRPATPDSLPVIGPSARRPDVFYAFGHGHLGLTLAATTGRLIAAMIRPGAVPDPGSPFAISRFA